MIKDKDGNVNWDRIVAVIGLLLTIGAGGYIKSTWHDAVESALVEKLQDKHSKVYQMIRNEADSVASLKTRVLMKSVFEDEATKTALVEAFQGFRGMDTETLVEYLNEKFDFADSIQTILPKIRANHEWVARQIAQDRDGNTMEICGTVYARENKPAFFKECDGDMKPVQYGKPVGRANLVSDVYYYRDDNDNPIIISYISNTTIR